MDLQAIRTAYTSGQPRLTGIGGQAGAQRTPQAETGLDAFGKTFEQAIQALNNQQLEADQWAARLAAGEDVDLHQVLIAMEQAEIGFRLALQVRTKLVEAYQEIMRMQV